MDLKHILCIDDDTTTHDDIYNTLTPKGYLMTSARSGREGVEASQKITPQLILLDLILPDMNGFEVVQKLRRLPSLKNTPIVGFSAGANQDGATMPFGQDFDAYLAKPITHGELFKLLDKFMR